MIVREKASGALHRLLEGKTAEEMLPVLGLNEADVDVYTIAEWEATQHYQDRVAQKAAKAQEHERAERAMEKVAARMPELANDGSMSVIYALWNAIDSTKVPNALKLALSEWSVEKGLPDRTGVT